jgi:hypothetical protein
MSISLIYITNTKIPDTNWTKKCPIINDVLIVTEKNYPLNNDFSTKRNHCLKITKNDWCLFLDTDETPSLKLIQWLNKFDEKQYKIKRIDTFLGKKLLFGETGNFYITRLINKKYGKFIGKVHEKWHSNYPIYKLNLPILHNSHQTINAFLEKLNFYSDIRAQELYNEKIKTNLFQIIFYPKIKFIYNYFIKLGCLDGTPGIINALGMSLHSFLVRSKLWHMQQH